MGPPPKEGGRSLERVELLTEPPARASMGPPPKEGGRGTRTTSGCTCQRKLQWGHPRKRVEGRHLHGGLRRDLRFNGATPERGWKVPASRAGGHHRALRRASMGPPPKEGGRKAAALAAALAGAPASMGPPPKEGGRSRRTSRSASLRCFNGATPERGWKGKVNMVVGLSSCCFNGATPERGWKDAVGPVRATMPYTMLQWGHPRKRVEGQGLSRVEQLRNWSFNGATPERGWKAPIVDETGIVISGLQWGHPRKRVEGRSHAHW